MMTWTPQPQGLQELLQTIHDSTDTQNKVQRDITNKLNSYTRVPDYIAYLARILYAETRVDDQIRTIAGYLLKNNARLILDASPEVAQYAKSAVLSALKDASPRIRTTAGQDIVAFLGIMGPSNWPECLNQLCIMLEGDINQQETALDVFEKACEDFPRKFDIDINGQSLLNKMIARFLELAKSSSSKVQSHSIACLSYFIPLNSAALRDKMDDFMDRLSSLSSSGDPSVRRHVCQAFVLLLAASPGSLLRHIRDVSQYMLLCTKDKNESVALEACEFWLTFAEESELASYLQPLLGSVAPVLLDCMVYGEDDLVWLEGDVEDTTVPDKATDIKPRHYGAKAHGMERELPANGQELTRRGAYGEEQLDDEEYDDDFDDDDFADDLSTEWNLRKCAAAALDVLAVRFHDELLKVLLVPLKDKLWSSNWLERESAILALGAIAEGCIDAMAEHLGVLVPYLIHTLSDPKPLIRSITCWTLGRYASWCAQPVSEKHKTEYFIPTMEGLLRMVLDDNKRVQEAGCSAFATLEEDAGLELVPFLEPVLRNLVLAFNKYQHKNMLILYDAVGTLADAVGRHLSNPVYVEILMPPLTARWNKLQDDDEDLIPLLECLASVTIAMGRGFEPYAPLVFQRCINIVHQQILYYQHYQQNPDLDEPDKSFLVVSLDLLSGLAQGMGMGLEPQISQAQPNLFRLVNACLSHPQAPVRQSAYALIGDLAMGCFALLRPQLPTILTALVEQLDPEPKVEFISACNNAAWSVGEVALRYGRDDPEFQRWVEPLISRLIPILLHPKAPRSLHENAAVSIGRIGLMHPNLVSPYLPQFAFAWCEALCEIRDNEEKDSAFRGLCTLVQQNPAGIASCLPAFCNAIVRWNTPSPELNVMFGQLLNGLKNHDPTGWSLQAAQFPDGVRHRLAERYGV